MRNRIFLAAAVIMIIVFIAIILIKIMGNKFGIENNLLKEQSAQEEKRESSEAIAKQEIFAEVFDRANKRCAELSTEEKIGQIFLVRYPEDRQAEILKEFKFGGYLFFERDFKGKSHDEIKSELEGLQEVYDIPILTAVDEEGGRVVRISSNKKLADSKFKSPRELYLEGGFDRIREDTLAKSEFLQDLGINLNLAPVVDVSTDEKDYMYKRALGENTELTSEFARTVISASKLGKVSFTLKHFPGYGNNLDTHTGSSTDTKSYEEILNRDLPPFKTGIEAGAEAILVSHNIVKAIDPDNPASLSPKVHEVLRKDLSFDGVIITDDLYMGAVSDDAEAVVKAILAGNDLIIVTDYEGSIKAVKKALEER